MDPFLTASLNSIFSNKRFFMFKVEFTNELHVHDWRDVTPIPIYRAIDSNGNFFDSTLESEFSKVKFFYNIF